VRKVLEDQTGCSKVRASNNIDYTNDVGMIQLFHNLIFSFYFGWLDGQQYFNNDILLGFDVTPLEYVRVPAASDFMRERIVFHLSPGQFDCIIDDLLNVLPLDVDRTVVMY
jgi:hypothetical protein